MNIAIVEDLAQDRERISSCLSLYMAKLGLTYQLYTYENAEEFVEALNTLTFRIVFMDIYLQGMTGMDAAVCLRRRNRDCKLIFLTISTEHCLEGFRVNACHYLIKPFTDHDFAEAMERCCLQPVHDVPYLDVVCDGKELRLNTESVLYIQIQKRKILVQTLNQTLIVSGPFHTLIKPLQKDKRFLLCIQGVLVNMDYITGQEETVFIVKNGDRLPINIRNKRRILQHYRDYIFDNM